MADYIDRDAVISEIERREALMVGDKRVSVDAMKSFIKNRPAADAATVTHWVLADEKLPPDGQDVLCWYEYFRFGSYHKMFQTYGIGYQYNGMWGGEVAQGQKARVLAWIPLPEAPKIDGGTENAAD